MGVPGEGDDEEGDAGQEEDAGETAQVALPAGHARLLPAVLLQELHPRRVRPALHRPLHRPEVVVFVNQARHHTGSLTVDVVVHPQGVGGRDDGRDGVAVIVRILPQDLLLFLLLLCCCCCCLDLGAATSLDDS